MNERRTSPRWFLLLLLLIGLCILFPVLLQTIDQPRSLYRTAAGSNLAQIAKTYAAYSNGSDTPRNLQLPLGSTTHDAAFVLAQKAALNDAALYFVRDDPLGPKEIPESVIAGDWSNVSNATVVAPDFANATLSIVIAANVSTSAPPSTTPIAWTRGLQPDGTWAPDSPYKSSGGQIAYLDGHVVWCDQADAKDPQMTFYKYGTHIPTHNIADSLPPGAFILPAEPRPRPNP